MKRSGLGEIGRDESTEQAPIACYRVRERTEGELSMGRMGDFLRGLDAWLEREDDRDEEDASEDASEKDDTASADEALAVSQARHVDSDSVRDETETRDE
jgi:hypothetical protein